MKSIISFVGYGFLYLFVFLFIFTVIYQIYIYRFELKPHGCMNDKCIKKRNEDRQFSHS